MNCPTCILCLWKQENEAVMKSCFIHDGYKSTGHIRLKRLIASGGFIGKKGSKIQHFPHAKSCITLMSSSNVKSAIVSWKPIECACHSMFICRTSDAVGEGNGLCMRRQVRRYRCSCELCTVINRYRNSELAIHGFFVSNPLILVVVIILRI